MIDQKTIRHYFHYDPITGDLYRKDILDTETPHIIKSKYISFKGKLYVTARIIYRYMVDGALPKQVMRIDGDVTNNKWSNITCVRELGTIKATGEKRLIPSAQKRTRGIPEGVLKQWFRYDNATKELWFIKDGANKLVTKTILTLNGRKYYKHYIVQRMRYINSNWEDYLYLKESLK